MARIKKALTVLNANKPQTHQKRTRTTSYKGNDLLKKTDVQIDWTPEQLDEFTRCAADIKYFIENYVYIENVDMGMIKFKLRPYQHKMIDSIIENRYSIFLASRQIGKCLVHDRLVTLRNKKTGEIIETTIGNFYDFKKEEQI